MTHLDNGKLRRMLDEPLAIAASDQAHFDGCDSCKGQAARISTDARAVERLMAVPGFGAQLQPAFARLHARIQDEQAAHPARWFERWVSPPVPYTQRVTKPVLAVAVAATLLVAFTGYEVLPRLLTVFHPTQIVGVQVTPSGGPGAGPTLEYGTLTWNPAPPAIKQASSLAAASSQSGLPAPSPGFLPPSVGSTVTYGTMGEATASYAFDAGKLSASASRQGVKVAPMPDAISGSTLFVTTGPSLVAVYGPFPAGSGAADQTAAPTGGLPQLVIAETRVPTVTSTGASAKDLQSYLLSQPGIPPDLAAQLKAIKDPTSTLPIPIPRGFATSSSVQVQNVPGLLIDAGLGAGVIWQKGGIIYAVGGQLTPDQILQIANSLP
jgi:hypothetical protein